MTNSTEADQAKRQRTTGPRRKGSSRADASTPERAGKRSEASNTKKGVNTTAASDLPARGSTKLDLLLTLLARPDGATLAELSEVTGWQTHSVRGAIAGTLKRKGHVVTSEKVSGARRYRIRPAS
jgi:homoserine dehydrogenase